MVPTPSRHSQTIALNRKAPAQLPPAPSIAAGAQADRSSDAHSHTHIPLPSSPTPAPLPLDLSQHWQSLLAEQTALLGYEITHQPDHPSFAKRSLRTQSKPHSSSASAPPATNPPPSAILAGLGGGETMDSDGLALPLLGSGFLDVKACTFNPLAIPSSLSLAEAKRAYCEASGVDRLSLARTSAPRSHSTQATTPARPPRLPRRRKCFSSSRRSFGLGFRVAA